MSLAPRVVYSIRPFLLDSNRLITGPLLTASTSDGPGFSNPFVNIARELDLVRFTLYPQYQRYTSIVVVLATPYLTIRFTVPRADAYPTLSMAAFAWESFSQPRLLKIPSQPFLTVLDQLMRTAVMASRVRNTPSRVRSVQPVPVPFFVQPPRRSPHFHDMGSALLSTLPFFYGPLSTFDFEAITFIALAAAMEPKPKPLRAIASTASTNSSTPAPTKRPNGLPAVATSPAKNITTDSGPATRRPALAPLSTNVRGVNVAQPRSASMKHRRSGGITSMNAVTDDKTFQNLKGGKIAVARDILNIGAPNFDDDLTNIPKIKENAAPRTRRVAFAQDLPANNVVLQSSVAPRVPATLPKPSPITKKVKRSKSTAVLGIGGLGRSRDSLFLSATFGKASLTT